MIKSKPEDIGEAHKESKHEMEERHLRVLYSNLAGLRSILVQHWDLPPVEKTVACILSLPHFDSNCLRSAQSQVRAASYQLFAEYLVHCKGTNSLSSLDETIFGCLREQEKTNFEPMLDMIIAYAASFPLCWRSLEFEKDFMNPLLWILESYADKWRDPELFKRILPLMSTVPNNLLQGLLDPLLLTIWTSHANSGHSISGCKSIRETLIVRYDFCIKLYTNTDIDKTTLFCARNANCMRSYISQSSHQSNICVMLLLHVLMLTITHV